MKVHFARVAGSAAALLAVTALAACGSSDKGSPGSGGGKDKVAVQLDYQVRGNHAMFYVAKEKGFFAKQGIDVTAINIGTGSPDAMRSVGRGQSDFAFGDLPTMAVAKSQGVNVVALVAVNQKSPLSLCSLKDKLPLTSPASLKGHTMGLDFKGSTFLFYKGLMAENGIPRSAVTERPVTVPYENFLLTGKVDAITCYIDAEVPELRAKAQENQGDLSIIQGYDFGYRVFGSGLVTSEQMVKNKPDLVKRFVAAYMEAFQWVKDNPQAAADIVAKARPELKDKAPIFTQQLEADVQSTFTSDATSAHGLGYMDPAEWATTVERLVKNGVIEQAPQVDSLYDNQFVEAADAAAK